MSLINKFKKKFEKKQTKTSVSPVNDEAKNLKEDEKVEKKKTKKTVKTVKKQGKEQKSKVEDKTGISADVLVKPLNTEKTAFLAESNQYVFEISPNATKVSVKHAIKHLYGVTPEKVRIVNVKGKKVRFRRTEGKRKDWKKAILTLKKGDKIEIFEGV